MLNPWIGASEEYSIISPLEKPWFLELIVSYDVEIPVGLTLNLRFVYPEPDSKTLTDIRVVLFSVLKRWIPLAPVSVDNPTVLIPAIPAKASCFVLNILTVDGLTTLTKYGSPSDKVPVIILLLSYAAPIPIGELLLAL